MGAKIEWEGQEGERERDSDRQTEKNRKINRDRGPRESRMRDRENLFNIFVRK